MSHTSVHLDNILEIDTCHDFRDGALGTFPDGLFAVCTLKTAPPNSLFFLEHEDQSRTLLDYLKRLDLNQDTTPGVFVHALQGVQGTNGGHNRLNNFTYENVVGGGTVPPLNSPYIVLSVDKYDPEDPINANINGTSIYNQVDYTQNTILITADANVINPNTSQKLPDNIISLFGIHDSNSSNGKVRDISSPPQTRSVPTDLINSTQNSVFNVIEEGDTHIGPGVRLACVIKKMTMTVGRDQHQYNSVDAEYSAGEDGGDGHLFFKHCKIHTNDSWRNVNHDIFTPFIDGFTKLTWVKLMKKKELKKRFKITAEGNGNLTLHCKGSSSNSASNLFCLMFVFCCFRDMEQRKPPAGNFTGPNPLINKCTPGITNNNVFLARMVSLLDMKRLGDHSQCFYTLKRGLLQASDDNAVNVHTTKDFWAGIHFGLAKSALMPPNQLRLTHPARTRLLVLKPTTIQTQNFDQKNIMFFGTTQTQTNYTLTVYLNNRNWSITHHPENNEFVFGQGGPMEGEPMEGEHLPSSIDMSPFSGDENALKNRVLEVFEEWCRSDERAEYSVDQVLDSSLENDKIYDNFSIYHAENGFMIFPHVWDPDTLKPYVEPGDNPDDPANFWVADTYFILTLINPTPETPGSPVPGSPVLGPSSKKPRLTISPGVAGFGKKQKRWVADLKGKKKFVRRQVYSTRKDLVTPSYFEKMTGADFWKLPVGK